jgi:hypothetical protein
MSDGIKTQNGESLDDRVDHHLQDRPPVSMRGGGGNQGLNALGQPYATSAIGSGPDINVKETNKARRGMSLDGNFERGLRGMDRQQDRERGYTR